MITCDLFPDSLLVPQEAPEKEKVNLPPPNRKEEEASRQEKVRLEKEKMQGTWRIAWLLMATGKKNLSQEYPSLEWKWTIESEKITMSQGIGIGIGKPVEGPQVVAYQLGGDRADKKPVANGINLTLEKVTLRGIFMWDEGKLKVYFPLCTNKRPSKIPNVSDPCGGLVFVLERVDNPETPKKAPPAKDGADAPNKTNEKDGVVPKAIPMNLDDKGSLCPGNKGIESTGTTKCSPSFAFIGKPNTVSCTERAKGTDRFRRNDS